MQRIAFRKIELWLVAFLGLLGALGVIAFGFLVLDAERGNKRFGAFSMAALAAAEIPSSIDTMLHQNMKIGVSDTAAFDGKAAGWNFPGGAAPKDVTGYLLLSRYDGNLQRHVIELVSLSDWQVKHSWIPDAATILKDVSQTSPFEDLPNWTSAAFRSIHPWVAADGGILYKDQYSPLFGIDACARKVWQQDEAVFHHSTERDADGNFWVPSLAAPYTIDRVRDGFREDQITKVSPQGKLIYKRSVIDLLMTKGYAQRLFSNGMYNSDPTHLNDIEPVLADGPYWKKGDVFISLRNQSMILLFRPSTDEIVWEKTGPWFSQHDVDILDDHRISIYNNDVQDRGKVPFFVEGASDVMVYDFTTGAVSRPWKEAMKDLGIRTYVAGQFSALPGGRAMIEDVNEARLVILERDGKALAEYVNRADNGVVYHFGWSRYIDKSYGDSLVETLKEVKCDE